jgi:hypothetical protein
VLLALLATPVLLAILVLRVLVALLGFGREVFAPT